MKLHTSAQVIFRVRDLMAARAGSQAFVERDVLEVAQVARRLGDRHVLALHDLAVAAGAPQMHAAGQFALVLRQMLAVIEGNPVVVHAAGQQSRFVASGAQAAGIGNLRRRTRALRLGDVLGQLDESQHFAPYFFADAGRKVALDAAHILVRRMLPRDVIGLHDVARIAELRAGRVPAGRPGHGHQQHDAGARPKPAFARRIPGLRRNIAAKLSGSSAGSSGICSGSHGGSSRGRSGVTAHGSLLIPICSS